MSGRVGHGDAGALCHPEQGEACELGCLSDGCEIIDVSFRGEIHPLPVGEPTSAPIVADDRVAPTEQSKPRAPDRVLPIQLEMVNPMLSKQQRWTFATGCVGNPRPIAAGAESDVLRGMGHAVQDWTFRPILARGCMD